MITEPVSATLDLAARVLLAYLAGSLSGALLVGRFYGIDIRTQGSGNAGGSNALRTQGWRFALPVVLVDLGKGVLTAALIAPVWAASWPVFDLSWRQAAAGIAAVAGHIWPLYFGGRGGKGAATAAGVAGALLPAVVLPLAALWIATFLISGYASLATLLAMAGLWPLLVWLGPAPLPTAWHALAGALLLLIVYTHRANIERLAAGREARFRRPFQRRSPPA